MTKNTLNIVRLYDCYVLSQNLNGGVNNELSLKIKKKLDKKIAELKNSEGGVFGLGKILGLGETEEKGKEKEKGEKGIGDILSIFDGNFIDGTTNMFADLIKLQHGNREEIDKLKKKVIEEGGLDAYLRNKLLFQQNKNDTEQNFTDIKNKYKQFFNNIGLK